MRTHADIIKEAGGAHAVARILHPRVGGELSTLQTRVRAWLLNDSIPGEYWLPLSALGVSSLPELAARATAKKLPVSTGGEAAA